MSLCFKLTSLVVEAFDAHSGISNISYILWDEGTQQKPNHSIISEDEIQVDGLELVCTLQKTWGNKFFFLK